LFCSSGTPDLNGEFDGSIGEGLFGHRVSPLAGLNPSFLNRVRLEKAIEVNLLAPAAFKVVKTKLTAGQVTNDWIPPVRQLHSQPGDLATEELECALSGLR
jgi:hypothetical protein